MQRSNIEISLGRVLFDTVTVRGVVLDPERVRKAVKGGIDLVSRDGGEVALEAPAKWGNVKMKSGGEATLELNSLSKLASGQNIGGFDLSHYRVAVERVSKAIGVDILNFRVQRCDTEVTFEMKASPYEYIGSVYGLPMSTKQRGIICPPRATGEGSIVLKRDKTATELSMYNKGKETGIVERLLRVGVQRKRDVGLTLDELLTPAGMCNRTDHFKEVVMDLYFKHGTPENLVSEFQKKVVNVAWE